MKEGNKLCFTITALEKKSEGKKDGRKDNYYYTVFYFNVF